MWTEVLSAGPSALRDGKDVAMVERGSGEAFLPLDEPGLSDRRPVLSVGFVLAPRFTLLAFASFVEALRHARREGIRSREIDCRWAIMGPTRDPVLSSCGAAITPTSDFRDPGEFDYIVVVGGDLTDDARECRPVESYLRRASRARIPLVGLCTGSFILARAGLLRCRRLCVHWYRYHAFVSEFPGLQPVTDELFVIDRDRITCVGGAASGDLAVHIIEKHFGKDRAVRSLIFMSVDGVRTAVWPSRHFAPEVADVRIRRAMLLVEQHVTNPLGVADLARAVHMSVRQFERVFRAMTGSSPSEFSRMSRPKHGRLLLAKTRFPVSKIALECGFSDSAHFCRHFKEHFGCTPSEFRYVAQKEAYFSLECEAASGKQLRNS